MRKRPQDRFIFSRRCVGAVAALSAHLSLVACALALQAPRGKPVRSATETPHADQASASGPWLTVTLKPGKPDEGGNIDFVDVTIRAEQVKADPGHPLLSLPTVVANVQTVAPDINHLSASDDAGPIPLTVNDDNSTGETPRRSWLAGRVVNGSITVQYRAPISNLPNPRGAAPPLELRTEDGAFSGAASAFLVLPETERRYAFSLHWDLSALPTGALGMSSMGVGDLRVDTPQSIDHVKQAYFFGGTMHRFPAEPTSKGFSSAWQGTPPFDGEQLMRWTERLYNYYLDFFRPDHVEPFAVLLRRNPINAGGGVEMGNSFIGAFDTHTRVDPFKLSRVPPNRPHPYPSESPAIDPGARQRERNAGFGLRRSAYRVQYALPLHHMREAAGGLRRRGPPSRNSEVKRGHPQERRGRRHGGRHGDRLT
jgi:hypothetical protein